ncbi:MAG: L-histidine N(alpha)-methyltransferase [Planctomycetota bacterium]
MPTLQPEIDREFLEHVREGLAGDPKTLSPKYLYDARGCELFEAICDLPEYYPTRTEIGILEDRRDEISARVPDDAVLIELGCGSARKTRILLEEFGDRLDAYVPVDIAAEYIEPLRLELADEFPDLEVRPHIADFTRPLTLGDDDLADRPVVVFFPGSTIGNFVPADAVRLMRRVETLIDSGAPGGGFLVGVDLWKDSATLTAAYDDAAGVTADFNLNLLDRMRADCDIDVDRDDFRHEARVNRDKGRVEMHLVAGSPVEVDVDGTPVAFAAGESIHTENSYKYSPERFAAMAADAGLAVDGYWTDRAERFSVQMLVPQTS